jgi:hypothetical protein
MFRDRGHGVGSSFSRSRCHGTGSRFSYDRCDGIGSPKQGGRIALPHETPNLSSVMANAAWLTEAQTDALTRQGHTIYRWGDTGMFCYLQNDTTYVFRASHLR